MRPRRPGVPPRVLTIAGSDSGGGAGIQADLKTIMALGGYGASAITAITAQNSTGVTGWWPVPLEAVRAQVEAVVSDLGVDAVKTGMLGSAELANTVADLLSPLAAAGIPIVVDPVLASTHADALLTDEALVVLRERVAPLATVLTPNLGEVRALVGAAAGEEQGAAVDALLALGPRWVLVKGGHLPGEAVDLLADATARHELTAPRLDTEHTHGTGCSLAAAIATGLAGGKDVVEAVRDAKTWLHGAIAGGYGIGDGPGPVDHAWRWR